VKRKLWNQSKARESLLGHQTDTMNPSIAAKSLFPKRVLARAERIRSRYKKRKYHKGNIIPAIIGAVSLASKLSGRLKKPSEQRAAAIAPGIIAAANNGNLNAARALIDRSNVPMIAKEHAVWENALGQLSPAIQQLVGKHYKELVPADQSSPEAFAASVAAMPNFGVGAGAAPAGAPRGTAASFFATPGAAGAVAGVVRSLTSRGRGRRGGYGRYPTYTDRYGRQRYSTKPPGTELRIPEGATVTPGTPYNFLRGAVGAGGALATVGQFAVAGAAGLAAYLVTQKLLEHLGGAAQRKEEAGVQAAMALHEALEEYKKQKGDYPPPAERAQMKEAYRAKLTELGYNPDTFEYQRSGVQNFLETYNPFGG